MRDNAAINGLGLVAYSATATMDAPHHAGRTAMSVADVRAAAPGISPCGRKTLHPTPQNPEIDCVRLHPQKQKSRPSQ